VPFDPVGERRLGAEHAGHWRDVGIEQTALFSNVGLRAQAGDEEELDHVDLNK
jgi:hypothetical protein